MEVENPGFDELAPSFADLPMEIILNIFRYLNFCDIQAASLTCQRWCEASQDAEFQSKVVLKFPKVCLGDHMSPGQLFLKSFRPFPSVYLEEVVLGSLESVFLHLGKTIEDLSLTSTDITEKQLCAILKETTNIKSLAIMNCSSLFMAGQFLESDHEREAVANTFYKVKNLSLKLNQYLSDAILLRITSLMPSLERLDMSGCHIAYHTVIQRRFYPPDREETPSESILTFKFLLNVIENHVKTLRELDLSCTLVGGQALISLAEIQGLDLRKLTFSFCRQLNFTGLKTLLQSQKNVTYLDLSSSISISDPCVEAIAECLPLLEVLKLNTCKKLTNTSIIGLARLKHLKVLDIAHCDSITTEGITQGIAKVKNESLQEIYLTSIDLCESCIIQCAENLPNLRVLDVGYCINGVTDRAVQAIIKNLVWLRTLNLEGCCLITDAAITGIDVKAQLSNEGGSSSLTSIDLSQNSPKPNGDVTSNSFKISLRSKAEEDIVQDAKRKKAMLAIYEMNQIDDRLQDGLSIRQLKGLQSLNLLGCNKISDVSLKYGLKFLELRRLLLSNCQQISLTGMQALVENCPSIEELDLSDCYNINDKAIEVISSRLRRLKSLNIRGCTQLTDHSLDYIVVNCKVLQTLSVHRCRRMCSDIDLRLSTLSSLRTLHMDRSSSMDNADIFRVKKHGMRWDY